jgi:hypothetical protein
VPECQSVAFSQVEKQALWPISYMAVLAFTLLSASVSPAIPAPPASTSKHSPLRILACSLDPEYYKTDRLVYNRLNGVHRG